MNSKKPRTQTQNNFAKIKIQINLEVSVLGGVVERRHGTERVVDLGAVLDEGAHDGRVAVVAGLVDGQPVHVVALVGRVALGQQLLHRAQVALDAGHVQRRLAAQVPFHGVLLVGGGGVGARFVAGVAALFGLERFVVQFFVLFAF